jgi:hypothetical protein
MVDVADRETFYIDMPRPGILKFLDTHRSKNQIKVEMSIFELNKVPTSNKILLLLRS